ncbi:MAG: acyl-ACP--UDP-N-acetylglucosamine O-acyltransferase [Verrucomicrobiota bacterium]
MIHPTAVIAPEAKLGGGVSVGPHSVIGENVTIGDGTTIGANVVIEGEVTIGSGNRIGHGSVIGGEPQDIGFQRSTRSRVEIGDGNNIREHCTIHRGTVQDSATTIGHENFLMVGVHIGHNCAVANKTIIANNVLLAGNVSIADQTFIGGGSVFHQNMRVGRLVMVQGSSGFGKDLPPFTLAAKRNAVFGLNVIGLRRAGFSMEQRDEIKRAFKLLYLSGHNTRDAMKEAANQPWSALGQEFFEFVRVALTMRGLCPYRREPKEEIAG